jgi:hypothetical protein
MLLPDDHDDDPSAWIVMALVVGVLVWLLIVFVIVEAVS